MPTLLGDGECDAACNVQGCGFDAGDCFHAASECYHRPDAADYRGTVSRTKGGSQCQAWSAQSPNAHAKTHANFPRAGLGGHNFCRNPDGEKTAWCFTTTEGLRWDVCDVGQPSRKPCPPPAPPPACPAACAALRSNGACDEAAGCNSESCLWDGGDCRNVLDELLRRAGIEHGAEAVGALVAAQQGFSTRGLLLGLASGLALAVCAVLACCCYCRRRLRARGVQGRGGRALKVLYDAPPPTVSAAEAELDASEVELQNF